jgi:hypothetical protein
MSLQIKKQKTHPQKQPKSHSDDDLFETSDLYLASYLLTIGIDMPDAYFEGQRMTFSFEDPDRCEDEELRFSTEREQPIKASSYARNVRALKALAVRGR